MKSILRKHNFYHDLEILILILKPIKEAIDVLEADTTNLADCFLNLVRLAVAIKKIPKNSKKNSLNTVLIVSIRDGQNSNMIVIYSRSFCIHIIEVYFLKNSYNFVSCH